MIPNSLRLMDSTIFFIPGTGNHLIIAYTLVSLRVYKYSPLSVRVQLLELLQILLWLADSWTTYNVMMFLLGDCPEK